MEQIGFQALETPWTSFHVGVAAENEDVAADPWLRAAGNGPPDLL